MPISDLSFKLYTDSGLTTPLGTLKTYTHNTDLSDNPQDLTVYFGSTDSTVQLQANSNPGVDDIVLTPTDTLEDWEVATGYSLGDLIEPTTPNGLVYKCTTAGTSHAATEPTWPTVGIGSTVSDNTVVWTLMGDRHELTEIKLALDSGDLGAATPGDPLNLGNTILGGVAEALPIYIRITNAVTTVRNNTPDPELALYLNEVIESEAP